MLEDRVWCVYIHKNIKNNNRYIGITSQNPPEKRWGKNGNLYKYENTNNKSSVFYNAIKKYGWDNFEHIVVYKNLTENEAKWKEISMIKYYNTYIHSKESKGYNMTTGGDGCKTKHLHKMTEEHRRKISISKAGKPSPKKGIPMSEEQKEKMRKVNLGKKASEETKRKMSESRTGEKNYLYGKKIEKETILKMLETKRINKENGWVNPAIGKKVPKDKTKINRVKCCNIIFRNVKECSEYFKIPYSTMSTWCQRKRVPKKYKWMNFELIDKEGGVNFEFS